MQHATHTQQEPVGWVEPISARGKRHACDPGKQLAAWERAWYLLSEPAYDTSILLFAVFSRR